MSSNRMFRRLVIMEVARRRFLAAGAAFALTVGLAAAGAAPVEITVRPSGGDATGAIQRAFDECFRAGGGTVFGRFCCVAGASPHPHREPLADLKHEKNRSNREIRAVFWYKSKGFASTESAPSRSEGKGDGGADRGKTCPDKTRPLPGQHAGERSAGRPYRRSAARRAISTALP